MTFRRAILALLCGIIFTAPAFASETKDIQFHLKYAAPVVFSHDFHLSKYNNNCRVCHNAIFNLKHIKHFTMAEMEKTRACGACHSGVKAFSVADEKSCVRCHKGKPRDVVFRVKGFGEAVFSHQVHIAKTGGKCKSCHNGKVINGWEKDVTMAQMEKGRTCGACHNGKRAFSVTGNCGNCHRGMKPREITFTVKGVSNAVFSHKLHTGMFNCKECHTKVFPFKASSGRFTMADMAKGKACGACHNDKEAFSTQGSCDKCHKGFKPGTITFKTDAGDATFSHDFHLGMFKCADCHTKIFPFKASSGHFTMSQMEKGSACGACHNGKEAFSVKESCDKCHKM